MKTLSKLRVLLGVCSGLIMINEEDNICVVLLKIRISLGLVGVKLCMIVMEGECAIRKAGAMASADAIMTTSSAVTTSTPIKMDNTGAAPTVNVRG